MNFECARVWPERLQRVDATLGTQRLPRATGVELT
jgi:hypothetical protein